LHTGGPKAGETEAVDDALPREKFIDGERVATARFIETQQPAADSGYDFRLFTDYPSFGVGCGKVRYRQWASVWPDHIGHAAFVTIDHIWCFSNNDTHDVITG
jgi:hypothetical protein